MSLSEKRKADRKISTGSPTMTRKRDKCVRWLSASTENTLEAMINSLMTEDQRWRLVSVYETRMFSFFPHFRQVYYIAWLEWEP